MGEHIEQFNRDNEEIKRKEEEKQEKLKKITDYKTKINNKLSELEKKINEKDIKNDESFHRILEIIRTFKMDMDLLNSTDIRIYDNIILDKLIKILSVIYNGVKFILYVVGMIVGGLSLIFLFNQILIQPILVLYSLLMLILIGGPIYFNSSRDKIIEYLKKHDIPSKYIPMIQGNLNVLYSNNANSTEYKINGYDYQFLNNINPFSSSDEVDAYLTNMVDHINGVKKDLLKTYTQDIIPINKNIKLKTDNDGNDDGNNKFGGKKHTHRKKLPYKRKSKSRKKRRYSKRKK